MTRYKCSSLASTKKVIVVIISLMQSALFSGIIFGWPAFARMFRAGGAFMDAACMVANVTLDAGHECLLSQRSSFAYVYTAASSLFIFSSLPGGLLLDRLGPACSSALAGCMVTSGFAFLATCADHQISLAFMLVGVGCSLAYSTSLKIAFLLGSSARTPLIAAVNALFDASALVPLALHILSGSVGGGDPDDGRAVVFYGVAGLSALTFGLWALSWYALHSALLTSSERTSQVLTGNTTARDEREAQELVQSSRPERLWLLHRRPFRSQCRAPQLWLMSLCMCFLYLRSSFYLSSARASLQALGDGPDESYMSAMLAMQPISIVFGPPTTLLLERHGFITVMYAIVALSCLGYACALVPSLQFQIATFLINGMVRASMYPTCIGYLAKTFGERTLGATTGFMFVSCGVVNLGVYPLSLVVNNVFDGDVRPVLATLCVLPTLPMLMAVRRLGLLKAGIMPFPRPWMKIMEGVHKSEMTYWGLKETAMCPICMMRPMRRPIELSCTHILCSGCATKMAGAGMEKCPVCRHPHLLDPKLLAERSTVWREAYGSWRQGKMRGAEGEVTSIRKPTVTGHHTSVDGSLLVRALDLAVSTAKPTNSGRQSGKASFMKKFAGKHAGRQVSPPMVRARKSGTRGQTLQPRLQRHVSRRGATSPFSPHGDNIAPMAFVRDLEA